jgi:hypothetical protein
MPSQLSELGLNFKKKFLATSLGGTDFRPFAGGTSLKEFDVSRVFLAMRVRTGEQCCMAAFYVVDELVVGVRP